MVASALMLAAAQPAQAGVAVQRQAPSAPQFALPVPGDTFATISWEAPAYAGVPKVHRYLVIDQDSEKKVCETSSVVLTCTISGLTNGTKYQFDVVAYNGQLSPKTTVSVTPQAGVVATRRPSAPQQVETKSIEGGLRITWNAPTDLGDPVLDRYTVIDPSTKRVWCDTDLTSCDIKLKAGKKIGLNIRAVNTVGAGPKVYIEGVGGALPSRPNNFEATPINGGVELTWEAPDNLGSPELTEYRVIDPSIPGVELCRTAGTSCVVNGLTPGKNKGFNIVAINDLGEGKHRYLEAVPGALASRPLDLKAIPTDGGAILTWAAPEDPGNPPADRYRVLNPSTGQDYCVDTTELRCEITGLTNGRKYGFNVVAINDIGNSVWTYTEVTPKKPVHDIVVRAKGERAEETFSVMIGNTIIGFGVTTGDYVDYSFTADSSRTGAVKVTFTNDFYDGNVDRNLWVDYVKVNGKTYESEADSTYSEGAWTSGLGCSPGFRRNERFTCGGTFTYTVLGASGATSAPGDPYLPEEPAADEQPTNHVIKVRAKGQTGGERFAVRIGREIIGQVTVTNEWRTYRFKLDTLPSGKLVVAFMNDSDDGYNDFNLRIDYVKVDDQKHESEDSRIYMAGPGPDTVCASGHKQSETLYCSSAFYYADL